MELTFGNQTSEVVSVFWGCFCENHGCQVKRDHIYLSGKCDAVSKAEIAGMHAMAVNKYKFSKAH